MMCNKCGRSVRALHPTLRLCHRCFKNPVIKEAADFEKWWMR